MAAYTVYSAATCFWIHSRPCARWQLCFPPLIPPLVLYGCCAVHSSLIQMVNPDDRGQDGPEEEWITLSASCGHCCCGHCCMCLRVRVHVCLQVVQVVFVSYLHLVYVCVCIDSGAVFFFGFSQPFFSPRGFLHAGFFPGGCGLSP